MKKNLQTGTILLLVLILGGFLIILDLPFSSEILVVSIISIFIMSIIHERYVFLYAMTLVLSYGAFLAFYAYLHTQTGDLELLYVYSHLLFSSFILLFWILLNHMKKLGYENSELKRQIQLLQKYNGETNILTVNEFSEQASWMMKTVERQEEEAWFVEINISNKSKRTRKSLQEALERVALETIRPKYDLVTSTNGVIYLLLKNTDENGAGNMLEIFREKVKAELNLLESPYQVRKEQVKDLNQLSNAVGGGV